MRCMPVIRSRSSRIMARKWFAAGAMRSGPSNFLLRGERRSTPSSLPERIRRSVFVAPPIPRFWLTAPRKRSTLHARNRDRDVVVTSAFARDCDECFARGGRFLRFRRHADLIVGDGIVQAVRAEYERVTGTDRQRLVPRGHLDSRAAAECSQNDVAPRVSAFGFRTERTLFDQLFYDRVIFG